MNLKQHFKQNAAFYKDLWIIALPIALQQLVTSSLNMVDTLMVGKVGVDAVAAVGVSNQYYFLLNMVMFGIYSGGMVYFAQFLGKKEIRNIHRLLGFTLVLGIGLAAIFTGLALLIPENSFVCSHNDVGEADTLSRTSTDATTFISGAVL